MPDVAEEAVHDLCRARADMVIDGTRGPPPSGQVPLASLPRPTWWCSTSRAGPAARFEAAISDYKRRNQALRISSPKECSLSRAVPEAPLAASDA